MSKLLMMLGLVVLVGCTAPLVRETSKDVASNAEKLNRNLSAYQTALEQDAAGRVDRIASQRVALASLEYQLNRRLAIWNLTDRKTATRLYSGVQKFVEATLAAERELKKRLAVEKKELKKTQAKYESQQKTLASLAKQLHDMAAKPDWKTQLKFLEVFAKETQEQLEELQAAQENTGSGP